MNFNGTLRRFFFSHTIRLTFRHTGPLTRPTVPFVGSRFKYMTFLLDLLIGENDIKVQIFVFLLTNENAFS